MTPNEFECLVAKAIDSLPEHILAALDNVAVCVEDDSEDGDCLGEYFGIPKTNRGSGYTGVLPDKIVLYRLAILDEVGPDPRAVEKEVRRTLWHEIAHHFGWDDPDVEAMEKRKRW